MTRYAEELGGNRGESDKVTKDVPLQQIICGGLGQFCRCGAILSRDVTNRERGGGDEFSRHFAWSGRKIKMTRYGEKWGGNRRGKVQNGKRLSSLKWNDK